MVIARSLRAFGVAGVLYGLSVASAIADEEFLDLGVSASKELMELQAAGPPTIDSHMRMGVESATRIGVEGASVKVDVAPPPQPLPWDMPGQYTPPHIETPSYGYPYY